MSEGCCDASKVSLLLFVSLFVFVLVDKTGLNFVENDLMGILEGLLETGVEGLLTGRSGSLLLASSLGSLLLESGGASLLALDNSLLLGSSESLGGRVDDLHKSLVFKRVLLSLAGSLGAALLLSESRLDLIGVDDSGEVSAGHHVSSKLESTLLDTSLSIGTEYVIELLESILGEDNESSEMTTRSELEKVQSGDVAGINTWEVSGGLFNETVLITVDDQRSLAEREAGASHLTGTSTELL